MSDRYIRERRYAMLSQTIDAIVNSNEILFQVLAYIMSGVK